MGSGAETAEITAERLNRDGCKTGVLKVRLFRPFAVDSFLDALPASAAKIAVLDRCREPGAIGEPLYQDVVAALAEGRAQGRRRASEAVTIGGRYGLASKEFTPAMVKAVFDELRSEKPKRRFTVGITDDVGRLSLAFDDSFRLDMPDDFRAVFVGLGADGTVGANKNSVKIVAEEYAALRTGLLRLRFQEIRRRHGFAPALQPAADQIRVPIAGSRLRRLPSLRVPRPLRHPAIRRARRARSCSTCRTQPAKCGSGFRALCSARSSTRS